MSTPAVLSRRAFVVGAAATAAVLTTPSLRCATAATSPALFVAAHPDDETLAMSVAIAEHVAAGQDVHVLWLTRGTASGILRAVNGDTIAPWWGIRHDPAAEGYKRLDAYDFGQARINEATDAVNCLATGLPGRLTVHEANLQDGAVTQALAADAILTTADRVNPGGPIRVKTHSHVVDNHADHLAAANAARWLRSTHPARFGDLRHYILSYYWTDTRLSKISESWDYPTDTGIKARAVNAYRAFAAWSPPRTYAIGWHSVPAMFQTVQANPRCMVHA